MIVNFCIRKYDIIAGGLDPDLIDSSNFIASSIYGHDEFTWCVARSKPIPQWKNLYHLHKDIETWIYGIILFSCVIIGVFLLTTFQRKPLDIWASLILSIQTVIGLPSPFQPEGSMIRSLHVLFCFIALLITTLYNAFTMNFLINIIYNDQISSVDEIFSKNFNLSGNSVALQYLRDHHDMVRIKFYMCINDFI